MRKILTIFLMFISLYIQAQRINKIPLVDVNPGYIEVAMIPINFKPSFNVIVDYGQERKKNYSLNELYLTDDADVLMIFNSKLALYNYLYTKGYTHVKSYYKPEDSRNLEYHFFVKQDKNCDCSDKENKRNEQ
ncbi:hypothetical protein AV926_06445 [Myroides marinus]|uniref:Uncharacterized protein n=1 Tax=Myroides marinus TaxID=703342 RepID=A0A165RJM2_9FLAO|nr:hypothetical protein [Myroides marinus]KZE82742.1 hypothetical protein AV926_06445 [Myroides marinus]